MSNEGQCVTKKNWLLQWYSRSVYNKGDEIWDPSSCRDKFNFHNVTNVTLLSLSQATGRFYLETQAPCCSSTCFFQASIFLFVDRFVCKSHGIDQYDVAWIRNVITPRFPLPCIQLFPRCVPCTDKIIRRSNRAEIFREISLWIHRPRAVQYVISCISVIINLQERPIIRTTLKDSPKSALSIDLQILTLFWTLGFHSSFFIKVRRVQPKWRGSAKTALDKFTQSDFKNHSYIFDLNNYVIL